MQEVALGKRNMGAAHHASFGLGAAFGLGIAAVLYFFGVKNDSFSWMGPKICIRSTS